MKSGKWMLAVILASALILNACDGGGSASNGASEISVQTASSNAMDGGLMMTAEENMVSFDEDVEGDDSAEMKTAGAGETEAGVADKKIVWTGYLRMETTEYDKTLQEMKSLFARYGVLVENSEEYDGSSWYSGSTDSSRTMSWQVRIPSDNFESFFEDTGSLTGQIRSKNTSSSDRTKQYSDTVVQIESLTIQQENLMEMMKRAESIEEMLAIEDRLAQVRSDLRILSNSNAQIDYDVDYSSISVEVQEVHVYQKTEVTYGERLRQALGNSLVSFVEALGDFVVTLIYLLPYLIVLALIWFLTRGLRKRFGERRAQKRAKKQAAKAAGRRDYSFRDTGAEEEKREE